MKKASGHFFFGRNGELENEKGALGVNRNAPLGEIHFELNDGVFTALSVDPMPEEKRDERFQEFVAQSYSMHGNYGPNGDIIRARMVVADDGSAFFMVEYIAALAYHKPGLAVDLVVFISSSQGDAYFVGIKRAHNPGQGKTAVLGGFRDVDGYVFEPAMQAAIREAKEEIGLHVTFTRDDQRARCSHDLNLEQLEVSVEMGGVTYPAKITRVGTFPTGDEEKIESLGLKRVYETAVFVIQVKMTDRPTLSVAEVTKLFGAADDASAIAVHPLADCPFNVEFGLSHHQNIVFAAMSRLGRDVQLGWKRR